MIQRARSALTFANVVSVLALFFALGGGVYAATQFDGAQIKKGSEPGNRLEKNSVTGKQVKEASLSGVGKCPKQVPTRSGDVCFGSVFAGTDWGAAVETCRQANLRLPSVSETWLIFKKASPGQTWTDDVTGATTRTSVTKGQDSSITVTSQPGSTQIPYFCVAVPGS